MENFKYFFELFCICVIELVKCIICVYCEEVIIKFGMNLFLLDSEDVFIDLLIDSGIGVVMQSMQVVMMCGDEVYSGSCSYYVLVELVKNIFGY